MPKIDLKLMFELQFQESHRQDCTQVFDNIYLVKSGENVKQWCTIDINKDKVSYFGVDVTETKTAQIALRNLKTFLKVYKEVVDEKKKMITM